MKKNKVRYITVTEEKIYWIWLSTISGIGARRFLKLLEMFDSPQMIYKASDKELIQLSRVLGEKCAQQILSSRNELALKRAESILLIPGINIITLQCSEYPTLLKTIYDPPPVLYIKGQPLRIDGPTIAVVGSRRSSEYGRVAAERISAQLAQLGVTVVSGLARGIDTMAHKGVLSTDSGYTIAVLGCGVDHVYPPENIGLYKAISERGTIISEYPPGTLPAAGNFPARNRIISGLSHGTLVIEAGLKSGALITVDCALEQGREVYALPGNISSQFSTGTNKLLKEGAKLITSVEDILEDLNITNCFGAAKPTNRAIVLDFFETEVYNALEDGEKGVEELIQKTGIDIGRLNAVLTIMEIKGIIKQIPGKIFMKQWNS